MVRIDGTGRSGRRNEAEVLSPAVRAGLSSYRPVPPLGDDVAAAGAAELFPAPTRRHRRHAARTTDARATADAGRALLDGQAPAGTRRAAATANRLCRRGGCPRRAAAP